MKEIFNKIIVSIMVLLIVLTSLPMSTFAAFITDFNGSAEFGPISGSLSEYGHELHYATYDGRTYLIFCAEQGRASPRGQQTLGEDFDVFYKDNNKEFKELSQLIYFGHTAHYGTGLPETPEAKSSACACQQLVWEYIHNNIDSSQTTVSRDSWNDTYMSSSIYQTWYDNAITLYNEYTNLVSFDNTTVDVNVGRTTTITDTQGALKHFEDFTQEVNGVVFEHSNGSNDLKITANRNVDLVNFNSTFYEKYQILPNNNRYSSEEMSNYIYFQFKGTTQNLMFSNYVDPISFSVNVGISSGTLKLKKVNDIGDAVEGCTFGIYSNQECTSQLATGTSNSNGELEIDSLSPGTVYIKELVAADGYALSSTVKQAEIRSGEITTLDFENSEPLGKIIINKVNSNGDKIEGATFVITAGQTITNAAGTKVHYEKDEEVARVITMKGTASVDGLPFGIYHVKELSAPNRLLT